MIRNYKTKMPIPKQCVRNSVERRTAHNAAWTSRHGRPSRALWPFAANCTRSAWRIHSIRAWERSQVHWQSWCPNGQPCMKMACLQSQVGSNFVSNIGAVAVTSRLTELTENPLLHHVSVYSSGRSAEELHLHTIFMISITHQSEFLMKGHWAAFRHS